MVYGVILAAGSGSRMKIKQKKQFLTTNNKSILEYSIEKFCSIKQINKILIVINKSDKNNIVVKRIINKYSNLLNNNRLNFVIGGKERYDSVYNSILYINDYFGIKSKDKILIHDSARPNVDIKDIKNLISKLNNYNAITLGCKLADTIKEVKSINKNIIEVSKTVDRNKYYLIKTPQGFNLKLLLDSYNYFIKSKKIIKITDDLQIIENFSKAKTYILDSNPLNFKITTKNDLNMLKYIT